MRDRRDLLIGFAAALAISPVCAVMASSEPQLANFQALLEQVAANEAELDGARSYRELQFRQLGPSKEELAAQPGLARRYASTKSISPLAKDLLIRFEVSGAKIYNAKYRRPVWPKGESGVTIGIGYDLGFSTTALLEEDWRDLMDNSSIERLKDACGVRGLEASSLVAFVQDVDVPWSAANGQLDRMLRFVCGETLNAFPAAQTLSPNSFGALVSVVYNRGGNLKSPEGDPRDRRREMRTIRDLLAQNRASEVPLQIRSMKRLWANDPNARGLLARRELEAQLFELGLNLN